MSDARVRNAEVGGLAAAVDYRWGKDEDGYLSLEPAIDWKEVVDGKYDLPERLLPADFARIVGDRLWKDQVATALEWDLCRRWDPKHADTTGLWRWMGRWVWTYDSQDKAQPVKRAPRYAYVHEMVRAHMERRAGLRPKHPHLICVKPRAIWWSWMLAAKDTWALVFEEEAWHGFMMSIKLRRVDDGGRRSSPNSLMGKVRFIYNRLPEWQRVMSPLDFQSGAIRNLRTGSTLVAEVAGDNAGGVGMQVDEGDIDEAGLIANLDEILAVAEPSARFLSVGGTPRAAGSAFHRKVDDSPERSAYSRFDIDWYSVPLRRACRRCGSTELAENGATLEDPDTGVRHPVLVAHAGPECRPQDGCWWDVNQERWTSPWFEQNTRGWSEDLRRREFEREWFKASVGRVFKSLRRAVHVIDRGQAPVPDGGERWEFWDHGLSDATAIWHIYFDGSVAYFLEYFEATNETAAWYCRRKAWVTGEFHAGGRCWLPRDVEQFYLREWGPPGRQTAPVRYFGDSAGANRESDGLSWHKRFAQGSKAVTADGQARRVGRIAMGLAPRPLVEDRIETSKWAIEDGRAIFVQDQLLVGSRGDAERGYNRLESYHRALDRATGAVRDAKPVHDASSHAADAFGYALVKFFGVRHGVLAAT